MPGLPRDRAEPFARRDGDRRRLEPRHRRDPRAARKRQIFADLRQIQDLHHRRSAPDHDRRVQRAAEDARGAARVREVHFRDDVRAESAGDHPVALPALRFPPHSRREDRRGAERHRQEREDQDRRGSALRDRAGRRWQPARQPVHSRPDRVVVRGEDHEEGRRILSWRARGREAVRADRRAGPARREAGARDPGRHPERGQRCGAVSRKTARARAQSALPARIRRACRAHRCRRFL